MKPNDFQDIRLVALNAETTVIHPIEQTKGSHKDGKDPCTLHFRLSAVPPAQWTESFIEHCRGVYVQGDVALYRGSIQSFASDVQALNEAIADANKSHRRHLEVVAKEEARKAEVREVLRGLAKNLPL